jgi:hypothetical protein
VLRQLRARTSEQQAGEAAGAAAADDHHVGVEFVGNLEESGHRIALPELKLVPRSCVPQRRAPSLELVANLVTVRVSRKELTGGGAVKKAESMYREHLGAHRNREASGPLAGAVRECRAVEAHHDASDLHTGDLLALD